MIKNLTVSYMLAITLAQGVGPAFAGVATAPTSVVASASARTVLAPVAQVRQERTATAQLSAGEMEAVRGDGWFSWIKKLVKVITTIIKILGAIKTILEAVQSLFVTEQKTVEGGETQQSAATQTVDYNSDADYNAGIVASDNTQVTSDWQQTEVWYGDGGGCGGGGYDGGYQMERMVEVSSC